MKRAFFVLICATAFSQRFIQCFSKDEINYRIQCGIRNVKRAQNQGLIPFAAYSPGFMVETIREDVIAAIKKFYELFNQHPHLVSAQQAMCANPAIEIDGQIETPEAEQFKESLQEVVDIYGFRLGIHKDKHPKIVVTAGEEPSYPTALPLENRILVPFSSRELGDQLRESLILQELAFFKLPKKVACANLSAIHCMISQRGILRKQARKVAALVTNYVDMEIATLGPQEARMVFDICKRYALTRHEVGPRPVAERLTNAATAIAYYNAESGRPLSSIANE